MIKLVNLSTIHKGKEVRVMKQLNYIVLDMETTGVDILLDEPIQIFMGAAEERGEKIKDELFLYCCGERKISQGAQNVHGISWEYLLNNGIHAEEAATLVTSFVWNHQPAILVGQNIISFDFPILWNWLARYTPGRFKHPPVCGLLDTMHLANMALGGTRWRKLEALAMELGVPLPEGNLHDAREDGRLTWKVFQELEKKRELLQRQ